MLDELERWEELPRAELEPLVRAATFELLEVGSADDTLFADTALKCAEAAQGGLGDYRLAARLLEVAEARAETTSVSGLAAWLALERAPLDLTSGRYERALVSLERARAWLESSPTGLSFAPEAIVPPSRLRLLLAEAQRLSGRLPEAWRCAQEASLAIEGLDEGARLEAEVGLLGLLAALEVDLGRLDRAHAALARSRTLAEQLAPRQRERQLAAYFTRRADAFGVGERHAEALQAAEEGLAQTDLYPEVRLQLELQAGLACAALEQEEPSRAKRAEALLSAVAEAPEVDYATGFWARTELVELALGARDPERAARRLEEARAGLEVLPGPAPVEHRARLAMLAGQVALARGAEGRELDSALAHSRAAYGEFLAGWAAAPSFPAGLGFLQHANRRALLGALVGLAAAAPSGGPQAALESLLEAQALGTLARRLGLSAPSIADVREALCPPESGLLIVLPAPGVSHVFALDATGLVHAEVPGEDRLRPHWRGVSSALERLPAAGAPRTELEEHARALSEALLHPEIGARLRTWRAVQVVGEDLLGGLPFECLALEGERALGLERALSYLPSVPVGHWLARRRVLDAAAWELDFFLLGWPERPPDPEAPALPFARRGATALLERYERARLARGAEANRASLAAGLAAARVTQVVAHGSFHPDAALGREGYDERPAAIELAPGGPEGRVDARWIEGLGAEAFSELVLLSACGGARGLQRLGDDGVTTLASALLCGGARTVLVARTDLEYHATMALSSVFHEELARGALPAEALRRARVALAADPRTEHPFFHSLLRVIGPAGRPLFQKGAGAEPRRARLPLIQTTFAAGALLAALAVALRSLRRRAQRPGRLGR